MPPRSKTVSRYPSDSDRLRGFNCARAAIRAVPRKSSVRLSVETEEGGNLEHKTGVSRIGALKKKKKKREGAPV